VVALNINVFVDNCAIDGSVLSKVIEAIRCEVVLAQLIAISAINGACALDSGETFVLTKLIVRSHETRNLYRTRVKFHDAHGIQDCKPLHHIVKPRFRDGAVFYSVSQLRTPV
jgi:hypothetical protein